MKSMNKKQISKEEREKIIKEEMSRLGRQSQRVQFGNMDEKKKSEHFRKLAGLASRVRVKKAKDRAKKLSTG